METKDLLLIGGLVVGGYVLMTSGILSPKTPYVPPSTGTGKEMFNVDIAGADFFGDGVSVGWLSNFQATNGRLPNSQERIGWWREEVGFEADVAWEMEDYLNNYWYTYSGVVPDRVMIAKKIRQLGALYGYTERA